MIACVEKTAQNADFYQIIDFLTGCSINYSLLVDPDLIGPWLQQFWATASLKVINDLTCFPKQVILDTSEISAYEGRTSWGTIWDKTFASALVRSFHLFLNKQLEGGFSPLDSIYVRSQSQHWQQRKNSVLVPPSRAACSRLQGLLKRTPNSKCYGLNLMMLLLFLNLPMIIFHQICISDIGGDEGLLDYMLLNRVQKRRRKRNKKKVSSVKLGRNKDEGTLSEEHNVQEEDTTHHFFDDTADQDAAVTPDLERKSDGTEEVNIEEKEASYCKELKKQKNWIWRHFKGLHALRTIQVMDSEEQHNAVKFLWHSPIDQEVLGASWSHTSTATQKVTDTQGVHDKVSLEGISMIKKLQVIDSHDGEYSSLLEQLINSGLLNSTFLPTGIGLDAFLGDLNIIWETGGIKCDVDILEGIKRMGDYKMGEDVLYHRELMTKGCLIMDMEVDVETETAITFVTSVLFVDK
ncbi:hypothetical protein Tco_0077505 [Tanacetum coccineum]